MNKPERISVRKAMRDDVTFIDGRKNVLDALRAMRDGECTSLVVDKRDDHDEYGILTLSDIAKHVIAKDRAPERVAGDVRLGYLSAEQAVNRYGVRLHPDGSVDAEATETTQATDSSETLRQVLALCGEIGDGERQSVAVDQAEDLHHAQHGLHERVFLTVDTVCRAVGRQYQGAAEE